MEHPVIRRTVLALFIGLVTSLSLAAFSASAIEAESRVAIPATAEGIWKAIDVEMAMLDQLITSNKLGTVHQHAYAVRDLVAALTTHSEKLPPADQQKLASSSKYVATLAARLDESGDGGDQAGAKSNYSKLSKVVESIRALGKSSGGH